MTSCWQTCKFVQWHISIVSAACAFNCICSSPHNEHYFMRSWGREKATANLDVKGTGRKVRRSFLVWKLRMKLRSKTALRCSPKTTEEAWDLKNEHNPSLRKHKTDIKKAVKTLFKSQNLWLWQLMLKHVCLVSTVKITAEITQRNQITSPQIKLGDQSPEPFLCFFSSCFYYHPGGRCSNIFAVKLQEETMTAAWFIKIISIQVIWYHDNDIFTFSKNCLIIFGYFVFLFRAFEQIFHY